MKTRILLSAAFAFSLAGCMGTPPVSEESEALRGNPEDAAPHLHWARDAAGGASGGSPVLNYGGGNLLITNSAMAIFWGNWSSPGDIIGGIDTFFGGLSGTNFAATSDEYTDASHTHITATTTYLGHVMDTSAAPRRALTTSGAVAEACKIVGNNPDPNAIYFIYTSTGAGHVNYCAWHSWGACSNGKPIQVAYMPNITNIAGCDPGDTSGLHSEGLAALANVTSHEWSEARTDPRGNGYTSASGAENGDECAWSFHAPVTLANGSSWKLQMEWSNAAYAAGTGFANTAGQNGCIQGN
jgi:hypothetical protein